jgi:outer membrane protein W
LVGNIDGGGLALGGEVEYGLTRDPRIGSGTIGLAFRIHSYSWNVSYDSGLKESLRVTPIAAAGNYHFALKSPKLDPYVGLALGYATASYSVSDGFSTDQAGSANSGLYLMIDGGGRYYLNPRTAIQAGISLGSRGDVGLLRVAAMFRL